MTCTKPKPNRKIRAALSKEIERLFLCVQKLEIFGRHRRNFARIMNKGAYKG